MKISELTIYGYGKWQNQTFHFNHDFIAFLGQNEMGKSTLQSFVQSMLFGLPKATRKKDVNLYLPKKHATYGGKLVLDDTPYGRLTIERIRQSNKNSDTIQTEAGEMLSQDDVERLFAGVTLPLFEQFFSLTLNQLQSINSIKKENLNRYFLTIGLSGSEQLFTWYDKWLGMSDKQYRPNGSKLPLNQQLEAYHQQFERVEKLANQQRGYARLMEQKKALQDELAQLKANEKQLNDTLQQENVAQHLKTSFERFQALSHETYTTTHLQENLFREYQAIQIEREALTKQLTKMQERIEQNEINDQLQWFLTHEQDIKYAVMTLPKIEKVLKAIATLDYQIDMQQEAFENELSRLKLTKEELPEKMVVLDEDAQSLLSQLKEVKDTSSRLQLKNERLQEQLDEQHRQKNQLQDQLYYSQQTRLSTTLQKPKVAVMMTGMIAGTILAIVNTVLSQWVWCGVGMLLAIFSGIAIVFSKNRYNQQKQLRALQEQERIATIQQRIDEKRNEFNQLLTKKEMVSQQLQLCQKDKQNVEELIRTYKKTHAIPHVLTLEMIESGMLTHVQNLRYKCTQLRDEFQVLLRDLSAFDETYSFFEETFIQSREKTLFSRRECITQFKAFVDKWQVEAFKYDEKNKHTHLKQRDIYHVQEQLVALQQQEKQLLSQANVKDRVSFEQLKVRYEKEVAMQQEKEMLQHQLAPYMEQFTHSEHVNSDELNQRLQATQNQKDHIIEQLAQCNQDIQQLEQNGEYALEKQKLAMMADDVSIGIKQVAVYQYASHLVERLLHRDNANNVNTILAYAEQLFARLTLNRYVKLTFTEGGFRVKQRDDTWFALHELSKGTLDQLYIALRLSFIKSVSSRVILPIIIDDCFVNFDDERKQVMLMLLEEFSKTHQVIYLTYRQDVLNTTAQIISLQSN